MPDGLALFQSWNSAWQAKLAPVIFQSKGGSSMICRWCGEVYDDQDAVDSTPDGFWCDYCEGFTFYKENEHEKHRLLLLLEEKSPANISRNTSCTPRLRKQLSPLRYPGGKSKLIDYLYSKLSRKNLDTFVEVYAGGASLGLSLLDTGVIQRLVLNEKDHNVYSFWKVALDEPQELIQRLQGRLPTHNDLTIAKQQIATQVVSGSDLAWAYLLTNRLSYSGIVFANPQGGKDGSQEALLARWKPEKLIRRIERVHSFRNKIELHNEDGLGFLENSGYWHDHSTIFVDPPYYEKGPALYPCAFSEQDHADLADLIQTLWKEHPGPDVVITYDNHPKIRNLYPLAMQEVISRRYSI